MIGFTLFNNFALSVPKISAIKERKIVFSTNYSSFHTEVMKSDEVKTGEAGPVVVPFVTENFSLKAVHSNKTRPKRGKSSFFICKKRSGNADRNITRALFGKKEFPYFYIQWSDCKHNFAKITEADEKNCIFDGKMEDDPSSKVLITGCYGEDNGVQIHSEVYGDWLFTTRDGRAFALEFNEDEDHYEYVDYIDDID